MQVLKTVRGRCSVILVAALLAAAGPVPAAVDATDELVALLSGMSSYQADFVQVNLDARGTRMQESVGQIAVRRPGLFYWHIDPPLEQLVVSDGSQLWLYDPDLEQVTVQPVTGALADTPALLLSGEVDAVRETYRVTRLPGAGGERYFELLPRNPDSLFESLKLTFSDGRLVQMHINDALGQRSSLMFSAIHTNTEIDDTLFRFTPPEGVDVISQ